MNYEEPTQYNKVNQSASSSDFSQHHNDSPVDAEVEFPRASFLFQELSGLEIPNNRILCNGAATEVAPALCLSTQGVMSSGSPAEDAELKTSKLFSPKYLMQDLQEAAEGCIAYVDSWYSKLGMSKMAKVGVTATGALASLGAFISNPVLGYGIGALVLWQVGMCYEKNRHGRAVSLVANSLYALHMVACGFAEIATCSVAATLRSFVQSMVADDRPVARAVIATVGFAATAAVYSAINNVQSFLSMENVPLFILGLGSASAAFNDRFSWASRLTNLTAVVVALGYHVSVTESPIGIFANMMFFPNVLRTIWMYDIASKQS